MRRRTLIFRAVLYNPQQRSDPMGDGSLNPYDQKGKGRAPQNGDVLSLDLDSAEGGGGGQSSNAFMQMQLVEQQVLICTGLELRKTSLTPFLGFIYPTKVDGH